MTVSWGREAMVPIAPLPTPARPPAGWWRGRGAALAAVIGRQVHDGPLGSVPALRGLPADSHAVRCRRKIQVLALGRAGFPQLAGWLRWRPHQGAEGVATYTLIADRGMTVRFGTVSTGAAAESWDGD